MKYFDRWATGEVTIVKESESKVLFDGDFDLAYWYYPNAELELIPKKRFAIYGIEEHEFDGDLTLDNLQRLADTVTEITGKEVAALVASRETRRELLKLLEPIGIPLGQVGLEANAKFPADLICAKPTP